MITRTGNVHVRTLLVESAWHHARRYSPASASSAAGTAAIGPQAAAIANEANRRLHERFTHLKRRGKPACVVNTAIAREMAGFLWALANCEG